MDSGFRFGALEFSGRRSATRLSDGLLAVRFRFFAGVG